MLGVVQNPHDDPADQLLRELGEELGVGDTYKKTPVAVYFGEAGKTVPDPYFGGEGPERTGCCLLWPLHGRLHARSEEHARQELPVLRGEAGCPRDARTDGDRRAAGRLRRRRRGL